MRSEKPTKIRPSSLSFPPTDGTHRTHRVRQLKLRRPVAPGVHRAGAPVRPPQAEADRWRALVLPDHDNGLRENANETNCVAGPVDAVASGNRHRTHVRDLGVQGDALVEGNGAGVSGNGQEQEGVDDGSIRGSLYLLFVFGGGC